MAMVSGVDFAVVPTHDFAAASAFYGDTLGLEKTVDYGKVDGAEYETGNLTLQLIDAKLMGGSFTPSTNPLALHVDDFEGAKSTLASRGVEFIGDDIDSGVCWMAFFKDPDGNALMIHHRYAPRD
jgi:predicted enzyme related to lactoylglutathione lyase